MAKTDLLEQFRGKVVIVTGGASGIGRAFTEELARRGAHITIADINEENALRTAESFRQNGGSAQGVKVDVSQPEQVQALVDSVVQAQGRLDYMFNNAGTAAIGEVRDMSLENWQKVLDVNLRGIVHGVVAAYPVMVKQGYGHIVNTASLAGLMPTPNVTFYCATKYGVVGLSTSLRLEAKPLGVKVSAICPGYINTPLMDTTTYMRVTKEKAMGIMPFQPVDPKSIAIPILEGVAKNKAIIVVPKAYKGLWWLNRLSPSLMALLAQKTVSDYRKIRIN